MSQPHYAMPTAIPLARTEHIRRKTLDVPYAAASPAQKLDIYLPDDGAGPFPVILSIHGGAFMGGDKADVQVMPMLAGLKRGYAVAAVNYRMSGEAPFPSLVQDVKAAIRWVRAHASEYGFDPQRVAAWGGSAGGYQAAMAGLTPGVPVLEDPSLGSADQSSRIQAVVDWFGPTDFLKMDPQLEESGMLPPAGFRHSEANSPESLLMGAPITAIAEKVRAANPETYITPAAPPFLIQHGTADDTVPYQQSQHFAEMLRAALGPEKVTLDLLPGKRHADPAFESPENLEKIFAWLDGWLKG